MLMVIRISIDLGREYYTAMLELKFFTFLQVLLYYFVL